MAEPNAYAVGEGRSRAAAEEPRPEPSIAQLVGSLIGDAQTLVRREIELARAEIGEEIGKARRGALVLAVGAGAAATGGAFLLVALAEGLVAAGLLDRWLAYLILGALLAASGGVALAVGTSRLRQLDPVPRETLDSIRKDVSWLSEQTPSDRTSTPPGPR